jgi:hypothetical protein
VFETAPLRVMAGLLVPAIHVLAGHDRDFWCNFKILGILLVTAWPAVAGSAINYANGRHGCTWATNDTDDRPSQSVADICSALLPLLPAFDDRADIAAELLRAHHQVIALLAGPIAEVVFTGARLPGSEHDDTEARAIAALICRSPASYQLLRRP